MAYDFPSLDTSHRQKFLTMLNMLSPVDSDYARIQAESQKALQGNFDAAQARIGAQFSPVMRAASARLGANPLLADSGYANRLNRQIQTAAFGDLSRAYGDAAAQSQQSQLEALQRLLLARQQAAQGLYGGISKKQKGFGSALGSIAGAGLGALVGMPHVGAAVGGAAGSAF